MPSLKLNLSPGEKLVSSAISEDQTLLIVSSLFECEDAPRCFRLFIFEIDQSAGLLRFLFVEDISDELFCNYPNSFLQFMTVHNTPEPYVRRIVAFPHAGGSERVDMFVDLGNKEVKVISCIPEYHTRSVLGAERNGELIWSVDGNG
jgi:hypothetical protein